VEELKTFFVLQVKVQNYINLEDMVVPQKIKNKTILYRSSTARFIPRRTESKDLNKYLYINVYNSIIHSNQKIETLQMSTDR
jgi:hypothetical protein